jgi:hypothetical protein
MSRLLLVVPLKQGMSAQARPDSGLLGGAEASRMVRFSP